MRTYQILEMVKTNSLSDFSFRSIVEYLAESTMSRVVEGLMPVASVKFSKACVCVLVGPRSVKVSRGPNFHTVGLRSSSGWGDKRGRRGSGDNKGRTVIAKWEGQVVVGEGRGVK